MTTTSKCSQCGADLPNDAPAGICPQCVLKQALGGGSDTQASTKPPGTAPELAEIDKYFPQLEILELLPLGGMGAAVYKARQKQLNRVVALKILPTDASRDPSFAERFTREAQALARLNHPNIVSVYDFGLAESSAGGASAPLYYFIMEYVDGANLRQMERAGQLTPAEALAIVPKICDALQYAHDEGIVHRDIKPDNILVDKKGRVKLADFGLAKLLGKSQVDINLTGPQQAMGTLHYMAPEQVEKPLTVDHRADIYSLGVVFYEMLTGELPTGRFALPSQTVHVDVRLDEVVLKTLETQPDRRYQHVSEVKTAVENVVSQPPVAAKSKYRPAVLIAVGLGVVVIIALVWWLAQRTPGKSSVSALTWRATLTQAETAYDENRFEEAIGLFDAALTAMNTDQKANPSVLKVARDKASKDRELAGFILDRSKLPLPQQIELTQQKLAEFNTNYTGKGTFTATKEGQIIAGLGKAGITDITPLKGLPMLELNLAENPVADLSPLRRIKLEVLCLWDTPVADLAPLKGMPLKSLILFRTKKVVDLSPLKGMTSLTNLNCDGAGIRDVGPLQGLPIKDLRICYTQVSDLTPLLGMPLEVLDIGATPVSDLHPLRGMPLKGLFMSSGLVADLSPLRTLKALVLFGGIDPKPLLNDLYTALRTNDLAQAKREAASLIVDCQSVPAFSNVVAEAREIQTALAQLAQGDTGPYAQYWLKHLKERGRGIARIYSYKCDTNGLIAINLGCWVSSNAMLDALHYVPLKSVNLWGNNLTNLQALAGLPLTDLYLNGNLVVDLLPLRGMKLENLDLAGNPVADLTPLMGMPLKTLIIGGTKAVDLSPLKGMTSLTELNCEGTGIHDVGPLQGMPLKSLNLLRTKVSDLTPLQGMPLESLILSGTPVSDLRPLKGMPLKVLWVIFCPVTDISPLQGMPLVELYLEGVSVTDLSPLKTLKALALAWGVDRKFLMNNLQPLLNDLYTALRTNDLAQAKKEAASLIADCQTAPAFSNVVAEAREIQTALAQLAQGDTGPYSQYWLKHLRDRGIVKNTGYRCDTNGLITLILEGCLASSNVDALHYVPLKSVGLTDNKLTNLQALAGLPLKYLYLPGNPVTDLSPLQGMKLEVLNVHQTPVADLTPLKGMPLKTLDLWATKVADLSPLKGMTSLTELICEATGIRDVGPLQGMPLTKLGLSDTKVSDLTPLQGMLLETLYITGTPVSDLRPLKGMPLKSLRLGYCPVTDISPLQGMPLTTLHAHDTGIADLSPLAGMPLEALGLDRATNVTSIAVLRGMKLTFLHLEDTKVADVTVLQGMPLKELLLGGSRVADLRPLDGMPLTFLAINRTPATNLPSLKGAPLLTVDMSGSKVSDLTPLAGLPLRELYLGGTPVADLSPLKGAPLTRLNVANTKVSDLTPLKGAPLDFIVLSGSRVSDLTPLKDCPLVHLGIAGTTISDLGPLKNAPLASLDLLNSKVTDLSPLAGKSSLRDIYANNAPLSDLSPLKGLSLTKISFGGTNVRDLSPLKGMKSLTGIGDFDVAGLLLADLRRAVEVKDNAAVKTLAPKLIADWQDVPAMADVVKQAKEMLGAAGK